MRKINIANEKRRDAQVGFELNRPPKIFHYRTPAGKDVASKRYLRYSSEATPEKLLVLPDLENALLQQDPEVEMELAGKELEDLSRVYTAADGGIIYSAQLMEKIFAPDGSEKERRPAVTQFANIADEDVPLLWTGKQFPKKLPIKPVSMFTKPENAEHFDIVVIDEAHHEATSSFINLYTQMRPKYLLGLSATPLRTDKIKLAFSATVSECNIHQLIRDGYLCKFNSYIIDSFTPETVAEHYLRQEDLWGKTLVFMPTLEECARFQSLIRQAGRECLFIQSGNDAAREQFEQGAAPLAVNCQLLTEGFDMPQLQTVFVRKSGRLPMIQMAGRVLRNHPEKRIANIVQPKNTSFPAKKMAEPEQILHWRKDRFIVLNGASDILCLTLRETLKRRKKLKAEDPPPIREYDQIFYVSA